MSVSWFEAINKNSADEFFYAVQSKEVADTYVKATGNQEYTPALYLARISPSGSKAMLSHLLSLDADLSLLATTEDCTLRKRCTTIGNLASWMWEQGRDVKTSIIYDSLVQLNNGTYRDPSNPAAEKNAQRWKKGWQPCITTGLGGKWKPGCGVPGISYVSSARRAVRNTAIGVGIAAKGVATGVGYVGWGVASASHAVLTSPFFLVSMVLTSVGGKTRKYKKRGSRSKTRKN
jgi:hypothetical protein